MEILERAGVPGIDAETYADTAKAFSRSEMLWLEKEAKAGHVTDNEAIEKITRLLAKDKDTSKGVQKEIIGKAGSREIALLKKELGIDVSEYNHTLDKSGINHTIKKHGDEKTEAQRGQIAITEDDFKLIPFILKNADTLEYSGKNEKGLDAIKYAKELDGTVIVVEEVRTGKKELAFSTMYKKKKGSGSVQKPSARTSETTSQQKVSPETQGLSSKNETTRLGAENAAMRKFFDTLVDGAKEVYPDGHIEALRAELAGEPRTADGDELYPAQPGKRRGGVPGTVHVPERGLGKYSIEQQHQVFPLYTYLNPILQYFYS